LFRTEFEHDGFSFETSVGMKFASVTGNVTEMYMRLSHLFSTQVMETLVFLPRNQDEIKQQLNNHPSVHKEGKIPAERMITIHTT
jgi:hypothetical protein